MKETVSFSLDKYVVTHFKKEHRRYFGSKSAMAQAIFKPALNCISEAGFDEFIRRLKTPTSEEHPDIDGI